ncbi:MAG: sulfatase [Acidobacteriia bacterium]|nr:sulfatase [Terriglobia bacterium]
MNCGLKPGSESTRRGFLSKAPAILGAVAGVRAQNSRPNILFAIADDQSWSGALRLGGKTLRTPASDRVGNEGVQFTNSFCAAPSCTPSRSAILTGRQIWQVQEGGVLYGTLRPEYPVFTHLLEDAGYHVGNTAKTWAPGNWKAAGQTRPPAGREFNSRQMASRPDGIDPRDYAANFQDFLAARKAGQPFFFWFGCTEPHRVYEQGHGRLKGKRLEDVEVPLFWPDTETVRGDILDYCSEIEWFDSHLGRMLWLLERMGELDNTLVVVTSDNGMPFPRAKVNLYDWGVHMPLSIRWGSRITAGSRAGRRVDEFVHHTDFAPTFLEAAGIRAPDGVTGRSLLPLFRESDPSRDCAYTGLERHTMCRPDGATYPIRGIRTARYLYLRNFAPGRWPTGGEFLSSNRTPHGDVDACPTKTFMTTVANQKQFPREYDLCFGRRPAEELYELQSDPWQMRNVAADPKHAAGKKLLRSRLEAYLRKTGDPRIEGRDPWQRYVYHQTTGYGASFNMSLPEAERKRARERDTHKPE